MSALIEPPATEVVTPRPAARRTAPSHQPAAASPTQPPEAAVAPIVVGLAFANTLDAEAYATRLAREPGFVAAAPGAPSVPVSVRLGDRCARSDDGVTTIVLTPAEGSTELAGDRCRRVSRNTTWPALLSLLSQAAGVRPCSAAAAGADRAPANPPTAQLAKLTPREIDVLRLVGQGLSVRQCATHLGITPSTVGNHKHRLMRKLGVRSSLELLRIAVRNGLASL